MTKTVWRRKRSEPEMVHQEFWVDHKKVASYKTEVEIAVAKVLFAGRNVEVKQVFV